MGRRYEGLIVGVLAGHEATFSTRDDVRAIGSSLRPVAVDKTDDDNFGAVLMLVRRSDGSWQCEVALAERDELNSWRIICMGGSSWCDPADLWKKAKFEMIATTQSELDDGSLLTAVAGYSSERQIEAVVENQSVGRTQVHEHGMFVIISVLAASLAEPTVEIRKGHDLGQERGRAES